MKALVFGGTRYFGKRLVRLLVEDHAEVAIATRGTTPDPFGNDVQRLIGDRTDIGFLRDCAARGPWDMVYDQIGFSPNDARALCEAFEKTSGRIVFTSSSAVYSGGWALKEEAFDPSTLPIRWGSQEDFPYPEGKRLTEAVYSQHATFPVVAVRFPIVLGEDDYTGRLEFHVDRIRRGQPIHVPSLRARISFVEAEDAAQFLFWLKNVDLAGPVNACSPESIPIGEIIRLIEGILGRKANLAPIDTEQIHTPFGIKEDFTLDTGKAEGAGFSFKPLMSWLPILVEKLASRVV